MDKEYAVYIYTMEYCAAIKRNEILPFATMCIELKGIILSEMSQSEKDNYHMISLIWGIWEAEWGIWRVGKEKNETRWDQEGDS